MFSWRISCRSSIERSACCSIYAWVTSQSKTRLYSRGSEENLGGKWMSEIKHKDWMNRLVGGCTYVYDSKQWHRSLNIQEFSKMSRSLGLSAVTPKDKIHTKCLEQ
ncbi:hypothetical protein CISG_07224 [Coccidioides immitis RMSCC 3703]|uniref:Uncharacterized protein n=1 Tax=Coccidioides immitis RMSCC 3703 TaxID=454286 RepID=A0A0J8R083_COCIT|nr:hypothetical protein CISG_07224 [Coccidioides immitis RMSCC 3703]